MNNYQLLEILTRDVNRVTTVLDLHQSTSCIKRNKSITVVIQINIGKKELHSLFVCGSTECRIFPYRETWNAKFSIIDFHIALLNHSTKSLTSCLLRPVVLFHLSPVEQSAQRRIISLGQQSYRLISLLLTFNR